jgi:hypothetical protein
MRGSKAGATAKPSCPPRRSNTSVDAMREIVEKLREYTLDEVEAICQRYRGRRTMRGRR